VINFHGEIDGKDFDGNKAENMELVIGANSFLADFENELIGCKLNEEKSFDIVFPGDYPKEDMANIKANFKIKIVDLQELEQIGKVSEEMLKKLGVESEDKLNELIKQKLSVDFMGTVRMKMKKELFDKVDKGYDFDLPGKMVDQDFEVLWKEVEKNRVKHKVT
jgi:trigger factor